MTHAFSYTNLPIVNMRDSPSLDSEVVSQTFLSERVFVQDQHHEWICITTSDQYKGWVPKNTVSFKNSPYDTDICTSRISSHIYSTPNIKYGALLTVAYQTKLKQVREENDSWILISLPNDQLCFIQKGNVKKEPQFTSKKELSLFARRFLGLPYTWGGRTSFGYDCSGFAQMLYSQIRIPLPRDSSDQIKSKNLQQIPMEKATEGDLIFFGQDETTIGHVGLFIGNQQFIHATGRENRPWLRISSLSDTPWSGSPLAIYPFQAVCQPIEITL